MTDDARRVQVSEGVLKRFAAAVKAIQLYSADHPIVVRATEHLIEALERLQIEHASVVIGLVDRQIVVDGIPMLAATGAAETAERFRVAGIERLAIDPGVDRDELVAFVRALAHVSGRTGDGDRDVPGVDGTAHIHVGRLYLQKHVESTGRFDIGAARDIYSQAVSNVEALWEQTRSEGAADPEAAMAIVEGLASGVGQNRRAMMALTALCRYDNYSFTHMVNVSVLTMAQAKSLGIDGTLLRQFGLAGLMHDIGKIRTPAEILTKPDKLTDAEFAIMKRHPVDGAEILRRQLELPPLAAVVAFEHHLRIDGTGYPMSAPRGSLNLATQVCGIADIYDAMRSQRSYQQAFPTDRIQAVLQQNDGTRFDQHLVRRFSQLLGIYPPGNMVRLDTGAIAVVLRTHAPDPSRPAVRVVIGPDGHRLAKPVDLALWMDDSTLGPPPRIVTPVDPKDLGIDPLPFLDEATA
ncbi:MAG: HD domain-containing protein [Acidobacteria bacterium]|nr:HD domain-containing protein [Acidobacteriota bacterium]